MRFMKVLLLCAAAVSGSYLRLGPSLRYMVFGSNALSEAGTISYETAESGILFSESEIFIPGFTAQVPFMYGFDLDLSVHWKHYDPAYVTLPDSASHPLERRGSISVFGTGFRHDFSDFYILPGAELQYFSEEWSDPYDGTRESLDSITVGPSVCAGTEIGLSVFSLKFEMGLVFPGFSDVQGRMDLSALLP